MSSVGPEQLAKRAMLAELLRQHSGHATLSKAPSAEPSTRRFSLDTLAIRLSSLKNWKIEEQDPFTRIVAPYKGFLYQRLGLDKTFVRGEGCYLLDENGTRYTDFVAQFGAVPFGHDPKPIWQALETAWRESRPNLTIGSISAVAGELAERLLAVTHGFSHVVFTNSGAEAVEAGFKLARCRTGRLGILAARNSFHGLTLAGMSATDAEFFQRGFGAPVPGFEHVPFGDLAALEATLERRPDYFAAFIVEIIQGESGIHPAPPGYVAVAAQLCRRFGALLIVDEVQTGLGRTGNLFACDAEGVTPDILALAKALGGGLMPIGACLYTRDVYTEQFDLRHGSTFAGNTLACVAAIATIDQLTKHDQLLVRQVAAVGQHLLERLRQLQREYPSLIADIRGRGLMVGIELDLLYVAKTQIGILAMLQEQGLLLYVAVSFLLNVEHIRVAASFTHATVLRIEPPLTADARMCDHLVDALRRLLNALQRGDAGELLGHLIGESRSPSSTQFSTLKRHPPARPTVSQQNVGELQPTRFAFVVHLLGADDLRRFDPSLARFDDSELERLKPRLADFIKPFPHGDLAIRSADGRLAEGELIVLPHSPADLLAFSEDEAVDLVQSAVDLAGQRGAQVIGLAGFSSIVTYGGLALRVRPELTLTSGNSFTTWAAMRAVDAMCARHGPSLVDCTVAIVGATGAIGHALSLLFAERAAEPILVGNPRAPEGSMKRLRDIARDCDRHVVRRAAAGHRPCPGTLAERLVRRQASGVESTADREADVTVTTDIDQHLRKAHVVVTATNAVVPFVLAHHLGNGALVCDVSRPFNISPDQYDERPDVRFIAGGLVRAPYGARVGYLEEPGRPNVLVACAAETIVLALSGFRSSHLCGRLDVATIEELGRLAEMLGFSVAS